MNDICHLCGALPGIHEMPIIELQDLQGEMAERIGVELMFKDQADFLGFAPQMVSSLSTNTRGLHEEHGNLPVAHGPIAYQSSL